MNDRSREEDFKLKVLKASEEIVPTIYSLVRFEKKSLIVPKMLSIPNDFITVATSFKPSDNLDSFGFLSFPSF